MRRWHREPRLNWSQLQHMNAQNLQPLFGDRGDKFYGQQWNKKKKVAKEQYHINSYEGL